MFVLLALVLMRKIISKMYRAAILFDVENNWIEEYFINFIVQREDFTVAKFDAPDNIFGFDLVFILGYTKILPPEFLRKNRLNLVVHESALPEGKGFAPVQWQILEGKSEIVVSLIEAGEKVDSGDIVLQDRIIFDGGELYEQIREKQADATVRLVKNFIESYPNFERRKQVGAESFYRKRTSSDGELDFDSSLRENFNLLRIGNNEEWPSFFYYEGKKYILKIYK